MRCLWTVSVVVLALLQTATEGQESPSGASPLDAASLAMLDWRSISGAQQAVATRFGEVSIHAADGAAEFLGSLEIRLDGARVGEPIARLDDYGYLAINNVIPLGERDIVLLTATGGGSGSPPPLLNLLPITASGAEALIGNPAFRSADWIQRYAMQGSRIVFDLGYEDKKRKLALLDGNRLFVERVATPASPLPDETCQYLHRAVGSPMCRLEQGIPQSVTEQLDILSHRPGFERQSFMRACETTAALKAAPRYEDFSRDVCLAPP